MPQWPGCRPTRYHQRGEFVLAVQGAPETQQPDEADADATLGILLDELPLKQAVALAVKLTGGSRNVLYQRALALKEKSTDKGSAPA